MSRKRKAPVRKIYPDPRYGSVVISKFINSIMYDGKRSTAEKILYDALDIINTENFWKLFKYSENLDYSNQVNLQYLRKPDISIPKNNDTTK